MITLPVAARHTNSANRWVELQNVVMAPGQFTLETEAVAYVNNDIPIKRSADRGLKVVTQIEGAEVHMTATNSSYTYSKRGRVLTRADAKSLIHCLHLQACWFGNRLYPRQWHSLARMTINDRPSNRFLPVTVIEEDSIAAFSYDAEGMEKLR
jgi:hypothetical protein